MSIVQRRMRIRRKLARSVSADQEIWSVDTTAYEDAATIHLANTPTILGYVYYSHAVSLVARL